jgi:hypothetical protein
VLAFFSERAGLAFCLAVPVLPLGNYALGLAVLYGIVAVAVFVATWRYPRAGLLAAAGAALGPIGALGLLPLAAQLVRRTGRRALAVAGAVFVSVAVASASRLPKLDVAETNGPLIAGRAVAGRIAAHPEIAAQAAALAVGAALLPIVRRRGPWLAAGYGAAVCGVMLIPGPHTPDVPLLAATAATSVLLAVEPYLARPRRRATPQPVEETTMASAAPAASRAARSAAGRG